MNEANIIDVSTATLPLIEIVLAAATAILGYAVKVVKDKLKIDENGKLNELIDQAILSGMNYAYHQLEKRNNKLTYHTEKEFVAHAANYVIDGVPNALKVLGVTKEHVVDMIESRLAGKLQGDDQ